MKVIYEANDGTKFEAEKDCKDYEIACNSEKLENQRDALYDLATEYNSSFKCCTVTPLECFNFIIDNIQEINKILDGSNYLFTGKHGEVYKAVDDPDTSCNHCIFKAVKFIEGENCCNSKEEFDCSENGIIWIKK